LTLFGSKRKKAKKTLHWSKEVTRVPEEVKGVAPYNANNSEINAISFIIQQAIREQVNTCIVCKVVARSGAYVDVLPLVTQISGKGEAIQPTTLYKLPYMRYHAGIAAVILDPVPGDIGLACFASKDCSNVKTGTSSPQQPGSFRGNTMANGFYIGGFLNQPPTVSIELTQGGAVNIVAPAGVNISGGNVTVSADVIASGISLVNHIHTGDSGGTTSPPIG
jgi:hypothetical protein